MDNINNAITQDITIVRGNTLAFTFELTGLGQSLSAAYFSCKADLDAAAYAFQKTLGDGIEAGTGTAAGTYSVRVAPEDTASLTPGRYYYDLTVEANDDRQTLMLGSLILVQGATDPAE